LEGLSLLPEFRDEFSSEVLFFSNKKPTLCGATTSLAREFALILLPLPRLPLIHHSSVIMRESLCSLISRPRNPIPVSFAKSQALPFELAKLHRWHCLNFCPLSSRNMFLSRPLLPRQPLCGRQNSPLLWRRAARCLGGQKGEDTRPSPSLHCEITEQFHTCRPIRLKHFHFLFTRLRRAPVIHCSTFCTP